MVARRDGGSAQSTRPLPFFIVLPTDFLLFYREVFKAKHRQTGKKVALKKVLMENEKEGVSVGAWLGCRGRAGSGVHR